MTLIGRISTAETFRSSVSSITDAQVLLNRFQEQLATGNRLLQPADDPVASAQITSLRNTLDRLGDYQVNSQRAEAALLLEEQSLAAVEDNLRRARDLILQAQNPVLTQSEREPIAAEIDGILEQLVAVGNAQNADAEYIFGGFASKTEPYTITAGAVVANSLGDLGRREINIADGIRIAVSDPGTEVFYAAPGNGVFTVAADATNTGRGVASDTQAEPGFDQTQDYTLVFTEVSPGNFTWAVNGSAGAGPFTGNFIAGEEIVFGAPGQAGRIQVDGAPANGDTFQISSNAGAVSSVFEVLVDVRDALTNSATSATRAISDTVLNQALQSIDSNLTQVSIVRTDLGVRLNRVADQENLNSAFNLQLQATVSSLEDVDYAKTVSELQLQLVALEAAQQTFVQTTGLTIFNYL